MHMLASQFYNKGLSASVCSYSWPTLLTMNTYKSDKEENHLIFLYIFLYKSYVLNHLFIYFTILDTTFFSFDIAAIAALLVESIILVNVQLPIQYTMSVCIVSYT